MTAKLPALTIEEAGTIRLALMGWAARCDAEAQRMETIAAQCVVPGENTAKALANAKASRDFASDARALLDKLNDRQSAEIVPAWPETLPGGFERLDATTLRAVVDHSIYTIVCRPDEMPERRYEVMHTGGARPEHLSFFASFFAPDLAQARITMCGGVGK